MATFTTPPARNNQHRSSTKNIYRSVTACYKRKEALKEIGRQQRHATLQRHRHSLSPVDLKGKLHADTMAAIKAQLHQPEGDGYALTTADIDALLRDIEQQVLEEIQAELAELEQQEHEQLQHAASMAEQHSAQGAEAGVLCPVCKSCQLVQRSGLLVCPAEGWRLNLAAESMSLEDIRTRLATAYEEHGMSGCCGHLCFHIEDLFGSDSLTCSCSTCNCLAVVV